MLDGAMYWQHLSANLGRIMTEFCITRSITSQQQNHSKPLLIHAMEVLTGLGNRRNPRQAPKHIGFSAHALPTSATTALHSMLSAYKLKPSEAHCHCHFRYQDLPMRKSSAALVHGQVITDLTDLNRSRQSSGPSPSPSRGSSPSRGCKEQQTSTLASRTTNHNCISEDREVADIVKAHPPSHLQMQVHIKFIS
jgi:hypothetical protein